MSVLPTAALAPRVAAVAAGFLAATGYEFSESSFSSYVQAFQQGTVLKMVELWALVPALKLVLLEEIAARGSKVIADPGGLVWSRRLCTQSPRYRADHLEKCHRATDPVSIGFCATIRPARTRRMDFESRDLYRTELAKIAEHSDLTETEVAGRSGCAGAGGAAREAR